MSSQRHRMSIHRVQSVEDCPGTVRRLGRQRRRNGLANILGGLSTEEVQGLRSMGDRVMSATPQAHPARRGSVGTLGISTEQLENLTLQRRRSVNGEVVTPVLGPGDNIGAASVLSASSDITQDTLTVPTQGPLRLSPASSLRALEAEFDGQGRNGDVVEVQHSNVPNSNYLRRRRNAVSYVNSTQFFLDTLVARASSN